MTYFVKLGRVQPLAFAEFKNLLKLYDLPGDVENLANSYAIFIPQIETSMMSLLSLANNSGGIVKISREIGRVSGVDLTSFLRAKIAELDNCHDFGVSLVDCQLKLKALLENVKKNNSWHYVLPKGKDQELSSAQIIKNKLTEFIVKKEGESFRIFQTIFTQNIGEWVENDLRREFIDSRLGMLPLKVARQMVNLARDGKEKVLLDPFCGLGTILAEALRVGINEIIGSDLNPEILKKCEENLKPVIIASSQNNRQVSAQFLVSDAGRLASNIKIPIDLIVTEPFLGDAKKIQKVLGPRYQGNAVFEIKNILRGLEKMYIGCLKEWRKFLVPEKARVVIVAPRFILGTRRFSFNLVEIGKNLGYNLEIEPLEYYRPQALVQRIIYVFKLGIQKNR